MKTQTKPAPKQQTMTAPFVAKPVTAKLKELGFELVTVDNLAATYRRVIDKINVAIEVRCRRNTPNEYPKDNRQNTVTRWKMVGDSTLRCDTYSSSFTTADGLAQAVEFELARKDASRKSDRRAFN